MKNVYHRKKTLPAAIQTAFLSWAVLQTASADTNVFTLGQIQVIEEKQAPYSAIEVMEVQTQGRSNVGEAIAKVPGVTLQIGGRRAETRANIRGFDSRQITLNLDGIPIYVPYDGNIDLSRFQLADLSQIEVSKSLGSLLEGPNNMGGSINLVTRKPSKSFEGQVDLSFEGADSGLFKHSQNVQLGSVLNEHFYFQAGVSAFESDDFPMSDDFTATENNGTVYQTKGNRLRSGSENQSANLKLGFTPNSTDEYSLSYYRINGSKESSPYAGDADTVRYWDWPQWDKQSVYYVGFTQLGSGESTGYLKSRLYYDTFDNALNSYDDDTYSSVTRGYAFRSQYNDFSTGGSVEAGIPFANHFVKAAAFVKKDQHKERDNDTDIQSVDNRWRTFEGETFALGLEDKITLSDTTNLTLGYRYDRYELTKTDDNDVATAPQGSQNEHNWQAKVQHKIGEQQLLAGVSLKSRFPNMKDQVSYRLGRAIPNLELQAEKALHYEVGLKGKISQVHYQANLFYSDIKDAIETIAVSSDQCGGTTCDQNQNVGSATSKGLEIEAHTSLTNTLDLGMSYAHLIRDLADEEIVATYAPKQIVNLNLDWYPNKAWQLGVDGHYQSDSQTRFDGSRPTDGFSLWDLRAHYQVTKSLQTNFMVKNLFDKNYEIAEGDPMPGRTLWANLNYQF